MSLKILVISDYRNTFSTRPEAEIFIDLALRGFHIDIMTYGEAEYVPRFEEHGIRVIDFHPQKKMDRGEISFIRDHLREGGHHIIHLFNGVAMVNGIQAAKKLATKIVLYRGFAGHVHWYDPTAYFKFLHPAVAKIVCNSKAVEDSLQRQLFFDKSKTEVILKGHDVRWYDDIKPLSLNTELQLPYNAFKVILVANDRPIKDIPTFLKASYFIPNDLPIYFIVVGKNTENKRNLPIIENSPNRSKIKLAGFYKNALGLVRDADVAVLISLSESFPKAAVEAMAMQRAVIVTQIPGNRELISDPGQGFKIPLKSPKVLAEKILELYHNPQLRQDMGQAARQQIDRLGHRTTVQRYAQLYQRLAEVK
ncbi:MAG: glycosyltransferase [Owenweeksia sp.]|nr:glycosyltransferase [Owenweeksia sp.]